MNNTPIIYSGQGASPITTAALNTSLRRNGSIPLCVDESYLRKEDWKATASALLIGGGNALDMMHPLEACAKNIRNFVDQGGGYLGICAGAYVACSQVTIKGGFVFDLYPLNLYLKPIYDYSCLGNTYPTEPTKDWRQTVRCSFLTKQHYEDGASYLGTFFWNLGPHFGHPKEGIVASYEDAANTPAAIIRTTFGKGPVVLSGVHPEISADESCHKEIQDLPVFSTLKDHSQYQQDLFQIMYQLATPKKTPAQSPR